MKLSQVFQNVAYDILKDWRTLMQLRFQLKSSRTSIQIIKKLQGKNSNFKYIQWPRKPSSKIFRISPSSSVMPLHFQLGLDVPTSMVHKAQQVPRYLYFRVDRDYRFSRDTNPLINRRKCSFEQLVTIWIERASCLHIRRMATSSNSAIPLQLSLILSILDLWNFFFLFFSLCLFHFFLFVSYTYTSILWNVVNHR